MERDETEELIKVWEKKAGIKPSEGFSENASDLLKNVGNEMKKVKIFVQLSDLKKSNPVCQLYLYFIVFSVLYIYIIYK